MENYYYQSKDTRIKALGPISNISSNSLKKILTSYEPYHQPMPIPEKGDWLSSQKESGQTFSEFMLSKISKPSATRKKIYINPLQPMSDTFLNNCMIYCQNFFYPLEIKLVNLCDIKKLKIESRINDFSNKIQYNASDINSYMVNYVPYDAHCLVNILMDDLYPKKDWNFVFGLANYYQRVCVFSFARFDPLFYGRQRPHNFENYILYRSCNTLTHEICHTFGLSHCIYYKCLLNGSNSSEEQIKRPLIECPICLRKLYEVIGFDCVERYKKMRDVCKSFGGYFEDTFNWYNNRLLSLN